MKKIPKCDFSEMKALDAFGEQSQYCEIMCSCYEAQCVWLYSSVGTGNAEVMGSNPVEGLDFFRLLCNC